MKPGFEPGFQIWVRTWVSILGSNPGDNLVSNPGSNTGLDAGSNPGSVLHTIRKKPHESVQKRPASSDTRSRTPHATNNKKKIRFLPYNKEKSHTKSFQGRVKNDKNKFNESLASTRIRRTKPRNKQQEEKRRFFTHNKERENCFREFQSDENKLNISKTLCFSKHKEENSPMQSLQGASSESKLIL